MNRYIVLLSLLPLLVELTRDALFIVKESLNKRHLSFALVKENVFVIGFLLFVTLWTWHGITTIISSFAKRGIDFRLAAFVGINGGYMISKALIKFDKTLSKLDKGKSASRDMALYFKYIAYPFGALFGISVLAFFYIVYHPEF